MSTINRNSSLKTFQCTKFIDVRFNDEIRKQRAWLSLSKYSEIEDAENDRI